MVVAIFDAEDVTAHKESVTAHIEAVKAHKEDATCIMHDINAYIAHVQDA